jgi:hypothetical protein
VAEDENVDKRLTVALELAPGKDAPLDVEPLRQRFLDRLKELNQDYREAARFIPPARRRADAGAPPGGLRPLRCQRHQAEEAVHPARVVQALA